MDSSEYHSICDFLSNSIYPDDLEQELMFHRTGNFMRKQKANFMEDIQTKSNLI